MSISEIVPTYRQLNAKGFFTPDADLIAEGEAFEWDGVPNEDMEPLNEPARKKLVAYLTVLDAEAKKAAEKFGRTFISRTKNLDEMVFEASADARRLELRKGDGGVPLMGGRGDGTARKVALDTAPRVIPRGQRSRALAQEALT